MKYMSWYLGIGALVNLVLIGSNRLFPKKNNDIAILSAGKSTWQTILETILGIVLLSPIWPYAIIVNLKERLFPKAPTVDEEQEFVPEQADLREQLSVEEIEVRERVYDPLGAVPKLPFGHLHHAWQKFLSQREPDDTIWTFESVWTPRYGGKEIMAGYAFKRGEEVGPHFLTLCKGIDTLDEQGE